MLGCVRFSETVIDIGTQGLHGDVPLSVTFCTGHFSTVQTAGNHGFDALSACAHGALHALLHCTTERNSSF